MNRYIALLIPPMVLFSVCGYSQQTEQPIVQNTIVFWGNFKRGDLVHYYTTKEVIELYSVTKLIDRDSVYYFEELVGDFIEIRFNNKKGTGVNYLCFPNDKIEILITGPNDYRLKSTDPIRQNELDWQFALDSAGLLGIREMGGDQAKIENGYRKNIEDLNYKRMKGEISERFYNVMKPLLRCTYISQSVYPILRDKKVNKQIDVGSLFDILLIDEQFLQLYSYNQALLNLTKASVSQGGLPLTKVNVLNEAKRRFEGKIRDYIPTAFIRWEITGNQFDYANKELLLNSIADPIYKRIIWNCYNRQIDTESMLNSLYNNRLKLANVIDFGKDTLLYVDFWASWCVPCKEEMKYYPRLFDKFKSKKVKFLFISLDRDVQAWKNEVEKHAFMDNSNSFILTDPQYTKVVKDLAISAIPRYLLFKDGEIYMRNALRPSEIKRFEDFSPRKSF